MTAPIALALFSLLGPSRPCPDNHCGCTPLLSADTARAHADRVFVGRVLRIDTLVVSFTFLPADSALGHQVVMEATQSWKGPVGDTVVVTGWSNCSAFWYGARPGEQYLVYATTERGFEKTRVHRVAPGAAIVTPDSLLMAGSCGRTAAFPLAAEDIRQLGPPVRRSPLAQSSAFPFLPSPSPRANCVAAWQSRSWLSCERRLLRDVGGLWAQARRVARRSRMGNWNRGGAFHASPLSQGLDLGLTP